MGTAITVSWADFSGFNAVNYTAGVAPATTLASLAAAVGADTAGLVTLALADPSLSGRPVLDLADTNLSLPISPTTVPWELTS